MPIRESVFAASCLALASVCFTLTPAAKAQGPDSKEAATIRQAAKEYVAAVNRGDADAIAAFWTEEGDLVDGSGRVSKGRDLAKAAAARERGAEAEARLAVTVDSIRFLTPEIAVEDGTVESHGDAGQLMFGRYSAIWVKRDDKWLLDTVRETAVRRQTHHDHLRQLAWMVGTWREEGPKPTVEMTCQWSPDKNFLLREIKITPPGEDPFTVSQRIGWDPSIRKIKGWTFDADGSFGEGEWSRDGQRWSVSSTGVLKDGQTIEAKTVYTRVGDDAFTSESSGFGQSGLPIPQHKLKLVRKPAGK